MAIVQHFNLISLAIKKCILIFFFICLMLSLKGCFYLQNWSNERSFGKHGVLFSFISNGKKTIKSYDKSFSINLYNRLLNEPNMLRQINTVEISNHLNTHILSQLLKNLSREGFSKNRKGNKMKIKVEVIQSQSINAYVIPNKDLIILPLGLIKKALNQSLLNGINVLNSANRNCEQIYSSMKKKDYDAFLVRNYRAQNQIEFNKKIIEFDLLSDILVSDFKKYMNFYLAHEIYHIMTNGYMEEEIEIEADLLASYMTLSMLADFGTWQTKNGTTILFHHYGEANIACKDLVNNLMQGTRTKELINNIYINTPFEKGGNFHPSIENRLFFVENAEKIETLNLLKTKVYEKFNKRNIAY